MGFGYRCGHLEVFPSSLAVVVSKTRIANHVCPASGQSLGRQTAAASASADRLGGGDGPYSPRRWLPHAGVYADPCPAMPMFSEAAGFGYCAAKKQYYYGLHGHLMITFDGVITAWTVTPPPVMNAKRFGI